MLRRIAWVAVGALLVLASLEVLFRFLPTSTSTGTGYYIDPDIWTYPPGRIFRTSFGWGLERAQLHRANNLGFIADHDFVADVRSIALVGDSYVEASMLPPSDRIGAQLERRIPGAPAYTMGGPGSSLLDYVERVRFAYERLETRTFVIVVERGDIIQSLCGSGNVHAKCLDPATLELSTQRMATDRRLVTNVLRESALAQYVFTNLRFSAANLAIKATAGFWPRATTASATPTDTKRRDRSIDAVVETFLNRLGPYRASRFVIVLGCNLNSLRVRPPPPSDLAMVRLAEAARTWGATVVDTEPLFRAQLDKGGLSLAVSPRDAHWNSLANHILGEAIAEKLGDSRR
jgi:hypothetical protein